MASWQYILELGDRSITLAEGESSVGRSRTCQVTLADASASRTHAVLIAREGVVVLRDLGSSNGTWVDGARVSGEAPLRNGALVTIGETVMTVRVVSLAPVVAAPPPEPVADVAATMRIEAIRPASLAPPNVGGAFPGETMRVSAQQPLPPIAPARDLPPIAPAAPSFSPPAPAERPVSRTDVFTPLVPPVAPGPVEKTLLEVPSTPRRPGFDEMRPREPSMPPVTAAASMPPPPAMPLPGGDVLGSIDALDHTALGARAVKQALPPTPVGGRGLPTPAVAGRAAGFWIRFGALLVDGVVIGLPLAVVNFVLTFVMPVEAASAIGAILGMAVGFGLPIVCWAMWGRTPGKALLRIAVVREGSTTPGIGFGAAIVRFLGYLLSFVILGIGFVMAAFGDKRALHDRIAGTRVIRL